ncbi:MAG: hypothetical protein U1E76_25040 [Planctomycetota bacterium]
MRTITTVGVDPYREVEKTPQGQLDLFGKTGVVISETVEWPVLVLLGAGIAVGLVLRPGPTLFCLLPAITYCASYIAVVALLCAVPAADRVLHGACRPAACSRTCAAFEPAQAASARRSACCASRRWRCRAAPRSSLLFLKDPRPSIRLDPQEHLHARRSRAGHRQVAVCAPAVRQAAFKVISPQSLPMWST